MRLIEINFEKPSPWGLFVKQLGSNELNINMIKEGLPLKVNIMGSQKDFSWPDLMNSSEFATYFFSERVVKACHQLELSGIKFFQAEIANIEPEKLNRKESPNYYLAVFTGRVEVEWFDIEGKKLYPLNKQTGLYDLSSKFGFPGKCYLKPETWDNSDFVRIKNANTSHIFCSEKFSNIAKKYQWKNFHFLPSDNKERTLFHI